MLHFTAESFINYLRLQKGYQEKRAMGSREQLSQLHWNPGSNNYTIFAEYFKDMTGRNYQGQAWCFMFLSTMLVKYIAEREKCSLSEAHTLALIELNASILPYNCQVYVNKNSQSMKKTPKIGALCLFYTGSKYGHVGLVTGVDANMMGFTTIEGNTSGLADVVVPDGGAVVEKHHALASNTLFYYLNYESNPDSTALDYCIRSVGQGGLVVQADYLRIRREPGEAEVGFLSRGEHVYPTKKRFVDGKAWYYLPDANGWVSASYLQGWVLEANNRWWYLMPGYKYTVSDWQEIDGNWYYFDSTGYMVSDSFIQSTRDLELFYYVNSDGVYCSDKDTVIKPSEYFSKQ